SAHAGTAAGLQDQASVSGASEDANEGCLRTELRYLEGEVRRIASRERLEGLDVTLEIPSGERGHRRRDPIDDGISDRDHPRRSAGHTRPSRVPAVSILRRPNGSRPGVRK